ncbi:MAG: hypothetical protein KIT83_00490 [Bryobacterales bacterium]|nr:hypothetical protein [Bryobacterales bacterium]
MAGVESNFAAERAELQALLDSGVFVRSPNLQKFLIFVCEKYFAGAIDEIKEYLVAVEALGRPADFDQKRDSIVRVEAHRLRKRLDEFYRGPGAQHAMRIELASGSYVPQFVPNPYAPAGVASNGLPAATTKGTHAIVADDMDGFAAAGTEVGPRFPLTIDGNDWEAAPGERPPSQWRLFVIAAVSVLILVVGLASYTRSYWYRGSAGSQAADGTVAGELAEDPGLANVPTRTVGAPDRPEPVRILAGSPFSSYVDRFGNTWTGDSFFQGGNGVETKLSALNFTALPELYQYRREGEFSYSIPVATGTYELRLHFAEPIFGEENLAGGGETSRLFGVWLNGEPLLREFDILADGFGAKNANIKVFRNVKPAPDGRIHLDFRPGMHESPIVSAIEVIPVEPGRIHPVRVVAGERGFTDKFGNYWSADHFVNGGRFVRRNAVAHPHLDGNVFLGERYGNFTYMIPVAADGRYRVRLYFCERWWGPDTHAGGGVGSRRFDVFLNGRVLLSDFDIFQQAGGGDKPLIREFRGVKPNAQGKLLLQFVPRQNYAMLNALEVLDESP